jgi:uncharacterized membrane protein
MSPISAMIFSVFGGLWVVFAILSQSSPAPILCVVPLGIAGGLVAWAFSVAKTWSPRSPDDRDRVNKIVTYASVFEGVAIFVGINVLNNLGLANQFLPLLAAIVGLHFLPFARWIPDRRYYCIAFLLLAIGIVGFMLPSADLRAGFVGVASALVLWAAAIMVLRTRHA